MRWSEEEYEAFKRNKQSGNKKNIVKKKQNKYRNIKTEIDGINFDSKGEARRYQELKLLEKAGEISDLELQPKFELQPTFRKNNVTHRSINYIADFKYKDKMGNIIVEDFKGKKTQVFRIKEKMFEYVYPDLHLKITGR